MRESQPRALVFRDAVARFELLDFGEPCDIGELLNVGTRLRTSAMLPLAFSSLAPAAFERSLEAFDRDRVAARDDDEVGVHARIARRADLRRHLGGRYDALPREVTAALRPHWSSSAGIRIAALPALTATPADTTT